MIATARVKPRRTRIARYAIRDSTRSARFGTRSGRSLQAVSTQVGAARAIGAVAVGAFAIGALAISAALAIAAAIDAAVAKGTSLGRVEIDRQSWSRSAENYTSGANLQV